MMLYYTTLMHVLCFKSFVLCMRSYSFLTTTNNLNNISSKDINKLRSQTQASQLKRSIPLNTGTLFTRSGSGAALHALWWWSNDYCSGIAL